MNCAVGLSSRLALVFMGFAGGFATRATGADVGYCEYADWAGWARISRGHRAGLASSYDRSGGNDDFSQYEYPEGLVTDERVVTVRTIGGPGVIRRFWMPHLTAKRSFVVRMYVDGESTPRLDTTSSMLFGGTLPYFQSPLVTTFAGGQVSYEPIVFAESLRIESVNKELPSSGGSSPNRHYYQYTFSTLPVGTSVASYPVQPAGRDVVAAMFTNAGSHPAGADPSATEVTWSDVVVPGGGVLVAADLAGPGIVRQLTLRMDSALDAELDALRLRVYYDQSVEAGIDAPVSDFFGAGHDRASYRSLPLGTDSADGFYSYWPMPYRRALRVELHNTSDEAITVDSVRLAYRQEALAVDSGYLHVHVCEHVKEAGDIYHPILAATGRGHYVGNLLYIEQDAWSFYMLEGDDVITVDGADVLHGTGLEDAYNGGYYYNWVGVQSDEPEGGYPASAIRPLFGILRVHREDGVSYARADQYRWQIADRVPFDTSIDVKIENRYAVTGSRWRSVGFCYLQPEIPGDVDADGDLDLADFAGLARCFGSSAPSCLETFDFDDSGQVDSADFEAFALLFSGPM